MNWFDNDEPMAGSLHTHSPPEIKLLGPERTSQAPAAAQGHRHRESQTPHTRATVINLDVQEVSKLHWRVRCWQSPNKKKRVLKVRFEHECIATEPCDQSGEPANWSPWLHTVRARARYPGMELVGGAGEPGSSSQSVAENTQKCDATHCHCVDFSQLLMFK